MPGFRAVKWVILFLALVQGGWLTFDGGRALIAGDFVTPQSGPHAGQLGPWSRVVSAAGFEPRSTAVKVLHVVLGVAWLTAMMTFAVRPVSGSRALLGCALATLWYVPIGTAISLLLTALLLTGAGGRTGATRANAPGGESS